MKGKKETLGISILGCYIHTVNVIKPYTSFPKCKTAAAMGNPHTRL